MWNSMVLTHQNCEMVLTHENWEMAPHGSAHTKSQNDADREYILTHLDSTIIRE